MLQALFLVTLLSTVQASVSQPKPPPGICACEKTAKVYLQWWINGNQQCKDDGTVIPGPIEDLSGSLTTDIDQAYCYDLTSSSSYKVWQPKSPGSAVKCTFAIYPEYKCKGKGIKTTHFPKTAASATCTPTIVGPGPEPANDWWPDDDLGLFPFRGYKSVKLSCKCYPPGPGST